MHTDQQRPPEPHLDQAQRAAVTELLRVAPVVGELAGRFAAAGHSLALVGGPVRDALLGRLSDDLDFTTDARPEQVLKLVHGWAEAVWDVGIAFGTVGAQKDGAKLEITTFRSEAYDRDSRKPEVAYGDSIEDDLFRRDFTVNAMAVRLTADRPLRVRRSLRRSAATSRWGAAYARHAGDVVLRRPAAHDARRALRRAARLRRRAGSAPRDDRRWPSG